MEWPNGAWGGFRSAAGSGGTADDVGEGSRDDPVIVKLTPNITDITATARAAVRGVRMPFLLSTPLTLWRGGSGFVEYRSPCRRQRGPWRLLRTSGEADCPQHGGRMCPPSGSGRAHLGNWRHIRLAGYSRVFAHGSDRRASVRQRCIMVFASWRI